MTDRQCDTERFYELLARLEERVEGKRTLDQFATGIAPRINGVYFFFEQGEMRSSSHSRFRVVRVGTHTGKNSTLGSRLFEHKVDRGRSVFRDHINATLKNRARARQSYDEDHWHAGCISSYIGKMPFLWISVADPGARKFIERNSIALLSNWKRKPIDPPSKDWLGNCREDPLSPNPNHEKVTRSGLWNVHYVSQKWDMHISRLLECIEIAVKQTRPISDGRDDESCLEIT